MKTAIICFWWDVIKVSLTMIITMLIVGSFLVLIPMYINGDIGFGPKKGEVYVTKGDDSPFSQHMEYTVLNVSNNWVLYLNSSDNQGHHSRISEFRNSFQKWKPAAEKDE